MNKEAQFQHQVNSITSAEHAAKKEAVRNAKEITDFASATLKELQDYKLHLALHTTKPIPMALIRAIQHKSR